MVIESIKPSAPKLSAQRIRDEIENIGSICMYEEVIINKFGASVIIDVCQRKWSNFEEAH
jgi:hypothetical protein